MPQGLGHLRAMDCCAHHDADPGAGQQQIDEGKYQQRDNAHQQPVERVVGAEHLERGEVEELRHPVFHREVAVEQLDQLNNDERQAKGQQQFVGVPVLVYATQEEALDNHPDQSHQHGRKQHRADKADVFLQGVGQVGAHHIKGGMGEIEHAHHAKDQRQAS